MGVIRAHEFITLDGVIDAPSWTFEFGFDPAMGQAIARLMGGCRAILLGRTTYEMFQPAWSHRTAEQDPGAPFMNDTSKYVVSTTLKTATWQNSTVIDRYDPRRIRQLKDRVNGGIYVSGSGTLVRGLMADGLLDELHLFVYPVTRATGPRLFDGSAPPRIWSLATSETYNNGVLYLAYQASEAPQPSTAAKTSWRPRRVRLSRVNLLGGFVAGLDQSPDDLLKSRGAYVMGRYMFGPIRGECGGGAQAGVDHRQSYSRRSICRQPHTGAS